MNSRPFHVPVLESLESKIAPAGTVTAVIAGGVLTLTGDLEANDIVITELMPDRFRITGQAGTFIKLGSAAGASLVDFDATVTSIKVDLKEGADVVLFDQVRLVKDVTVNLGIGANTARFNALSIGGNLSVQGGNDADQIFFRDRLLVGGNATFAMGNGTNSVEYTPGAPGFDAIQIDGALKYTGGTAGDGLLFNIASAILLGSVDFAPGAGGGFLTLESTKEVIIGGKFNLTTLDHAGALFETRVTSQEIVSIGGALTVKNGTGQNVMLMEGTDALLIGGAVSVTQGNVSSAARSEVILTSTDHVSIEGGVTIKNGNGDYTNRISAAQVEIDGAVAVTNGNSGATSTRNEITSIGGSLDIQGGISYTNGSGTYTNDVGLGGSSVNVGGTIKIVNKNSTANFTGNTILGARLFSAGVSITNGMGKFFNSVAFADGRIAGNLQVTNGDSTAEVSNGFSLPLVTGNVTLKNGNGDYENNFFSGNSPSLRVGGNLSITNGTATAETRNLFFVSALDVDGSLTIKNGDGHWDNFIGSSLVNIKGSLSVTNGNTNNFINNNFNVAEEFRVGGSVSMVSGNGEVSNFLGSGGALLIGGSVLQQTSVRASGATPFIISSPNLVVKGGVTFKSAGGDTTTVLGNGGQQVSVGGALNVSMGDGNDSFSGFGFLSVTTGAVSMSFGNGNTSSTLGSNFGTVIKGGLSVTSLVGDDSFTLVGGSRIGGALSVNYGAGSTGTFVANNFESVEVAGAVNLNFAGLTGAATVTLNRLAAQGNMTYVGSAGADTLAIRQAVFRGNATFSTGNGADQVSINDTIFLGTLGIQTGVGADTLNIEHLTSEAGFNLIDRTTFSKAVTISMGDDADSVLIGGGVAAQTVEFKAAALLDGGIGTDTLTTGPNIIGTLTPSNIP